MNQTATQGREVIFTCVVNHLGPYKVAWIKSDSKAILAIHTHLVAHNNRLSVTHNGHNTWKLKVSNVQKEDSGTYMCQINTDPMKSQMAHLEVNINPDILNEEGNDDHVTTEGGTIRLRCRAVGKPEPKVTWKREDSKSIVIRQEDGKKLVLPTVEGEELMLSNVQRTDMGYYVCIATNGIPPSVSKRISVKVHFHPMVKVPNQLVGAPVGRDVSIQCYVETSPRAMHSWYKETGEKLMGNSKYEMKEIAVNDYTLLMNMTIKTLEKRDFGSYLCSSVNAIGKAEGVVRLQEMHIPKTTVAPVANVPKQGRARKTQFKDKVLIGSPPPPTKNRKRPKSEDVAELLLTTPLAPRYNIGPPIEPLYKETITQRTPPWILHQNEISGIEKLISNRVILILSVLVPTINEFIRYIL
ncbi:lachesin-like isoform X2 [Rhodnius prolixus]